MWLTCRSDGDEMGCSVLAVESLCILPDPSVPCGKGGMGVQRPCPWRCPRESVHCARPLGSMWRGWDGGAESLPVPLLWSLCILPDPSVPCGEGGMGLQCPPPPVERLCVVPDPSVASGEGGVGPGNSVLVRCAWALLPWRVCAFCQTPRCQVARVGWGCRALAAESKREKQSHDSNSFIRASAFAVGGCLVPPSAH